MSQLNDQTLALAGIFHAAHMANHIAKGGAIDALELEPMINALVNTNPLSNEEIFGNQHNIRQGLSALRNLFGDNKEDVKPEVLKYAMSLLHVEGKVRKDDQLLNKLASQLEQVNSQISYFDSNIHPSVIGGLANAYLNTVSTLDFRIQITGNPDTLKQSMVADQIRCVLLFGVRCALLWRQRGGNRWHLLFKRKKISQQAHAILNTGLQ